MIFGLITSFVLELLVLPTLYYIAMSYALRQHFEPRTPPSAGEGDPQLNLGGTV